MSFQRNLPYPRWNTTLRIVPNIPNWNINIGTYNITFGRGSKVCYVTKVYSGDYTVHITSQNHNWNNLRYTDTVLWQYLLVPNITVVNGQNFIDLLRNIIALDIEQYVLCIINQSLLCDELKVCLYTLWHRAIIEDRLYSSPYLGHRQVIGITIAIIKKIMGVTFNNDNLIQILPFNILTDLKCNECGGFYVL